MVPDGWFPVLDDSLRLVGYQHDSGFLVSSIMVTDTRFALVYINASALVDWCGRVEFAPYDRDPGRLEKIVNAVDCEVINNPGRAFALRRERVDRRCFPRLVCRYFNRTEQHRRGLLGRDMLHR